MRFDVSEMKTLNECGRKWQLSSRNAFHLRPKGINSNLAFGSLFHEALHALYLGADIDKLLPKVMRELPDPVQQRVMMNMLTGYAEKVLPQDLAEYEIKDIEHSFSFSLTEITDGDPEFMSCTPEELEIFDAAVDVCGSIDMIAIRKSDNSVWGFEHKSASKFRPDIYIALDEQPRVYYMALQELVNEMNFKIMHSKWEQGAFVQQGDLYKVGGIIINEVKKVQRIFEYARHECVYSEREIQKFRLRLIETGRRIRRGVWGTDQSVTDCNPSYMKCQMCEFAGVCSTYGYQDVDKDDILDEFCEEYEEREVDHLDEKVERRFEDA